MELSAAGGDGWLAGVKEYTWRREIRGESVRRLQSGRRRRLSSCELPLSCLRRRHQLGDNLFDVFCGLLVGWFDFSFRHGAELALRLNGITASWI